MGLRKSKRVIGRDVLLDTGTRPSERRLCATVKQQAARVGFAHSTINGNAGCYAVIRGQSAIGLLPRKVLIISK